SRRNQRRPGGKGVAPRLRRARAATGSIPEEGSAMKLHVLAMLGLAATFVATACNNVDAPDGSGSGTNGSSNGGNGPSGWGPSSGAGDQGPSSGPGSGVGGQGVGGATVGVGGATVGVGGFGAGGGSDGGGTCTLNDTCDWSCTLGGCNDTCQDQ